MHGMLQQHGKETKANQIMNTTITRIMPSLKNISLPLFGILAAALFQTAATPATAEPARHVLSLDGRWQIAEGKMEQAPATFERTVSVPGLVSLATPAFTD